MSEKPSNTTNPETRRTNRDIMVKGLQRMGLAVLGMFLGPSVFYAASFFDGFKKYAAYSLGVLLCLGAVWLAVTGLKTIMRSMFSET